MLVVLLDQQLHRCLWDGYQADGVFRFGPGELQGAVRVADILLADGDRFALDVHVIPPQGHQLSLPQAADQLQIEHGEQISGFGGFQIGVHIFRGENLHLDLSGLGCNAVGVTGARIIDSPRERAIAVITNSLTPCNGRFPFLIAVISIFLAKNSIVASLILLAFIVISIICTMISSKVLSKTVLKGKSSSLIFELPKYKVPDFKNVIISTKLIVIFVIMRYTIFAL